MRRECKPPLPVDIRNSRCVVRMDQNVLALKVPSEAAQGKAYCQQLEAIDMPIQLGTHPNP